MLRFFQLDDKNDKLQRELEDNVRAKNDMDAKTSAILNKAHEVSHPRYQHVTGFLR
jgi:hypothetical protein